MHMMIKQIIAREILDSRGFPTVEAQVVLENGQTGSACVPSGASTGSKEALELRDNDKMRYKGKGVLKAVDNIHRFIAPKLKGMNCLEQKLIDDTMIEIDGTENKSKLGANAMLAVSMANAVAGANSKSIALYEHLASLSQRKNYSLPVPMLNILNGGAHADNQVDIQEFMVLPIGAKDFKDAMRFGSEIYHSLKSVLKSKGLNTNVGDEGGFAPDLPSNEAALEMIMKAIEEAALNPGKDVLLGLDVAATELYQDNHYVLSSENRKLTSDQFIDELHNWVKRYPIISIEDGLSEDDWQGWQQLTEILGRKVQLVGDDLFVTNPTIFAKGINSNTANAILIKLNQIGTLSETIQTIQMAFASSYNAVVSHRSGETEDTFIADLAVALNVGQIKTGAPCRSDRIAKYNRLLRIEEMTNAPYASATPFKQWLK